MDTNPNKQPPVQQPADAVETKVAKAVQLIHETKTLLSNVWAVQLLTHLGLLYLVMAGLDYLIQQVTNSQVLLQAAEYGRMWGGSRLLLIIGYTLLQIPHWFAQAMSIVFPTLISYMLIAQAGWLVANHLVIRLASYPPVQVSFTQVRSSYLVLLREWQKVTGAGTQSTLPSKGQIKVIAIVKSESKKG